MNIETMSKRQVQGAAIATITRMHDAINRETHVPRHLTPGGVLQHIEDARADQRRAAQELQDIAARLVRM
jgi:hypothetical protein